MVRAGSSFAVFALTAALAAGCGGSNESANGAEGTTGSGAADASGTSGRTQTVLSGCVERNTDTGNFVLVVDRGSQESGQAGKQQPVSERIILQKATDDMELNQIVGRRATLEGTLEPLDAIADAGTETVVAGEGADPWQLREGGIRGLRVSAVRSVGDTCTLENR